jgi:predicted PurR-regulated permease PerM
MDERRTLEEPERFPGQTRARLLAVASAVLVIAFLKWSHAATMPLAFAVFLIALAWPLAERLERRLPRWASLVVTILTLLLAFALFVGALVWTGRSIAERAPEYSGRLQEVYARLQGWASGYGISLPSGGTGSSLSGEMARPFVTGLVSTVSLTLLVVALVILGLIEVPRLRARVGGAFRHAGRGEEILDAARSIAAKFQRYLVARTIAALIQGVTVALFALLVGLDLPLLWGLIAFLLNYIPTIGSVLAVVPPVLFSLLQFDGFGRPLLVLGGMAVLQLLCGNYLDPLIQGRYLSLSPTLVLFAVVFWGWVWGIPGALLGVPITMALVIAADHFPSSRWIARLLSEGGGPGEA